MLAEQQFGLLLDSIPKKSGNGYILVASTTYGSTIRLHTYSDFSLKLSKEIVYEYSYIEKEIPETNGATFNILKSVPKRVATITERGLNGRELTERLYKWYETRGLTSLLKNVQYSTDLLENAGTKYLTNNDRFKKYDGQDDVWDRIDVLATELSQYYKDCPERATEFLPTYNAKYDTQDHINAYSDNNDEQFTDHMTSSNRYYQTKLSHITVGGKVKDSRITSLIRKKSDVLDENGNPININNFPKSGINSNVDSVFAYTCYRERHISEFYIYFALATYLKRSRRFPNGKFNYVYDFLSKFMGKIRLKWGIKAVLIHMSRIGMIKIEGNPKKSKNIKKDAIISILSQSHYVKKWETVWNTKQIRYGRNKELRVRYRGKWVEGKSIQLSNKLGTPIVNLAAKSPNAAKVLLTHRPYTDLHFPKTAKLDTGFINLLLAKSADQKAFLYEMILSSWNYSVSRQRISNNLHLVESTQYQYERMNKHFLKRYNHTEIPKDMFNKFDEATKVLIEEEIRKKGKFKRLPNGTIFRQEGNTYASSRITWRSSRKAARLRLSPKQIKTWLATRPFFTSSMSNNNKTISKSPKFLTVNDELLTNGQFQQLTSTFVTTKKDVTSRKYFALSKRGINAVSTNQNHWGWFQPLMSYASNGDVLLPGVVEPLNPWTFKKDFNVHVRRNYSPNTVSEISKKVTSEVRRVKKSMEEYYKSNQCIGTGTGLKFL